MLKRPRYIPVEGNKDLVRDSGTKAILNINNEAFEAFKRNRERIRQTDKIVEEHESMKNELSEIKSLLKQLLEKS
jgi:hypothetical protein